MLADRRSGEIYLSENEPVQHKIKFIVKDSFHNSFLQGSEKRKTKRKKWKTENKTKPSLSFI